ncbi:MAG: GIY-YIG nuclease family protein [Thermoguttaceae bacterium]|nr:GIY-YIG nuclease family protein [Thermoguttaceae bacterium]
MARGKNIQLFLIDGNSSERIKCTLANWTGVAFRIPRTDLDRCNDRTELKQSGVYFLFGRSDETEKDVVYIGQAIARKNGEGLLNRLKEHRRNPEKDYWTEAIVFTTSNNSLGATELNYLENQFCQLARKAKRYDVKNENSPNLGNITEEKEAELGDFIDFAKVIMGTLGHKLFEPIIKPSSGTDENSTDSETLFLERTLTQIGETVRATGMQTADGFVVYQGSHISPVDDNTIPSVIKERRQKAPIDENHVLQEDLLFTSPTYAAIFVIGKRANGPASWKTADGRTLKSLEEQE